MPYREATCPNSGSRCPNCRAHVAERWAFPEASFPSALAVTRARAPGVADLPAAHGHFSAHKPAY